MRVCFLLILAGFPHTQDDGETSLSITVLLAILLVAQIVVTLWIMWQRYRANRDLFKTNGPLTPVRTNRAYFGACTALYDFLDRIPLLRRSGRANELDLLKAMCIVSVPTLLVELLANRPTLLVSLVAAQCLATMINVILLAHPALKRSSGGK
jgi:hypothetical protein